MRLISFADPTWNDGDHDHITCTAVIEVAAETEAAPAVVVGPQPFQASRGAPGLAGEAFDTIVGSGVTIAAYVAPPSTVPASISRRQCAEELFAEGSITIEEAVAMAASATPPAAVAAVIDALPEADRGIARIRFAAGSYERENQLLIAVIAGFRPTATANDIDDFFRLAGAR